MVLLSSFRAYRPHVTRIKLRHRGVERRGRFPHSGASRRFHWTKAANAAARWRFPWAQNESAIAVFSDPQGADAAVKKLAGAGFAIANLSVVGKGNHSEEKVVGFYDAGDRIKFWGKRGAFWGGLWGMFAGGVSLTIPVVGHIMVLGYLAAIVASAVEGAIMVGGLSALGAALYSAGIPRDSVVQYEQAVRADGFLVLVQGAAEELGRAKRILCAWQSLAPRSARWSGGRGGATCGRARDHRDTALLSRFRCYPSSRHRRTF